MKSYREILRAGIIAEPGNTRSYNTGSWRTFKPIWDGKKCRHCLLCWLYCPDTAIEVEDGRIKSINYFHCKGCGICAKVCPDKVKAISMEKE